MLYPHCLCAAQFVWQRIFQRALHPLLPCIPVVDTQINIALLQSSVCVAENFPAGAPPTPAMHPCRGYTNKYSPAAIISLCGRRIFQRALHPLLPCIPVVDTQIDIALLQSSVCVAEEFSSGRSTHSCHASLSWIHK